MKIEEKKNKKKMTHDESKSLVAGQIPADLGRIAGQRHAGSAHGRRAEVLLVLPTVHLVGGDQSVGLQRRRPA